MIKKRLVILDMHAILHRAYHALPDFTSSKGEPTGALYGLVSMLIRIITELKPDYIVATFDLPKPTHRHIAYDKYKAHRPSTDDALVSQLIRSRVVLDAFAIPRYELEGFEADDLIGTIVEDLKRNKVVDVVIASGDMDTLQLVSGNKVQVFTLKKGLSETILYNEEAVIARYGFEPIYITDYKGLRGDPSDNIPGIKGIGEKTASILISRFKTIEKIYEELEKSPKNILAAGIKEGIVSKLILQKEEAEFSKALAVIRRDAPIAFELPKKEWQESININVVLDMLADFEFRSLISRVRGIFHIPETGDEEVIIKTSIPEKDFNEAALAVWVLDSSLSSPTADDIYRLGRSKDFNVAFEQIKVDLEQQDLTFVYKHIELPLVPILRAMEIHGIRIDKNFLKSLSLKYHTDVNHIADRIYEAAGEKFNINSPKQLGEILFNKLSLSVKNQKKTAGGAISTKESELEKMKDLHPIIKDVLAHRELRKLLSTYIDTIPGLLDDNNRLHTSFIQTGTTTGRLSSQNPNLQNIPIKSELGRAIRKAFIADTGMSLLSFDYSQIELRIAAVLSHDEALREIFVQNRDVHTEVAARVFSVPVEEVTYEQRRRAKIINFGILYGMGVNSLRESLGTTRAEAQEFYSQYFKAFPKLSLYIDEVKAQASREGYTTTRFGRKRHFEGIHSPIAYVRASAERMAINAPIQGTQSDIIKLAMVRIGEWIQKENLASEIRMLLQVHDELVFEIQHDRIESHSLVIKEIMENILLSEDRDGIPFCVEGKTGNNWGEMKKV